MATKEDSRHSEIKALLTKTLDSTESTRAEVVALSTNFALHVQKNEHDFDRVGARLAAHSDRLAKGEDRAEATGAHDVTKLQTELAKERTEREASALRWRNRAWALLSALVLSGFGVLVTVYFK